MNKPQTKGPKSKGGRTKKDGSRTDSNVKSSRTDSFTVAPTELLDDRRLRKASGSDLAFALLLFFQCDDWGLFEGDAHTMGINLKGKDPEWIEAGMRRMEAIGLIERYEAIGWDGLVGRIIGYHDYTWVIERKSTATQRTKSRFPLPDGTMIASRNVPYTKPSPGWLPEWAKDMLRSRGQTAFDDQCRFSAGSVQVPRKSGAGNLPKTDPPKNTMTELESIPHPAEFEELFDHENVSAGSVQVQCWDRVANPSLRSGNAGGPKGPPAISTTPCVFAGDPDTRTRTHARPEHTHGTADVSDDVALEGATSASPSPYPQPAATATSQQQPQDQDSEPELTADERTAKGEQITALLGRYAYTHEAAGQNPAWPSEEHERICKRWLAKANEWRAKRKDLPLLPERETLAVMKALAYRVARDKVDRFVEAVEADRTREKLAWDDDGKGVLSGLERHCDIAVLEADKHEGRKKQLRAQAYRVCTGKGQPGPGEAIPELSESVLDAIAAAMRDKSAYQPPELSKWPKSLLMAGPREQEEFLARHRAEWEARMASKAAFI